MSMRDHPAAATASIADAPGVPDLEELFARYERGLGQFLAQVVRSRSLAEDLLQDTFVVALRNSDQLPSIVNPQAWLYGIARNRALDALRRRRRRHAAYERLDRSRFGEEPDPSEALAVRDFLERNLAPADRLLVVLRYLHGFDSAELALMTHTSSEAIRQRLHRSRKRLIEALEHDARSGADPIHKESNP
jgi:RNA polymerase sigma-70 factor, ECF subfamily